MKKHSSYINIMLNSNNYYCKFSVNSIFAIPANQEYVFMDDSPDQVLDWEEFLTNSLINMCNNSSVGAYL